MNNATLIEEYFDEILADAKCELFYKKDYELVLSVMLSAQCTDKKVNAVVEPLFLKYDSLDKLNSLSILELENILKPLGLFKNKAKNFKGIVESLIFIYNYNVPSIKKELIKLPGVGVKTANVVLAEYFKIPAFAVDTHVNRVSKRLLLASKEDNVDEVEKKLTKIFAKDKWIKLHHQFIWFGRYKCKALKPDCKDCKLASICSFYKGQKV